jgi:hypothetical protein
LDQTHLALVPDCGQIGQPPRGKIVNHNHAPAFGQQPFDEM